MSYGRDPKAESAWRKKKIPLCMLSGANYNSLVSVRVDQGAQREEEWYPLRFFSDLHALKLMAASRDSVSQHSCTNWTGLSRNQGKPQAAFVTWTERVEQSNGLAHSN